MAKHKPAQAQTDGGRPTAESLLKAAALRFCPKCGYPFKWERFAEAKWQRVSLDGTPHRDSCSAAGVSAKSMTEVKP